MSQTPFRHYFRARHDIRMSTLSVVLADKNISGFGGHIAISGYRMLSQLLANTFSRVPCCRKTIFAVGITILSVIVLAI